MGVREILLDSNDVTTVPSAVFSSCESLQTLSLHGNPVNEDMLVHVQGCVQGEGGGGGGGVREGSRAGLFTCVRVRESESAS